MRPSLSIVGAGRVGRALGRALSAKGWRIGGVLTNSAATARAAVRAIGSGRPLRAPAPALLGSDVVLMAMPDSAIARVAAELAAFGGGAWRGKTALHVSGALPAAALEPLAACGASVAAMHPFQTFGRDAAPELRGVLFTIQGDAAAARVARRMALDAGGVPLRIAARVKPGYHAAGAFPATHLLTLMAAAASMMQQLGFPQKLALAGLLRMARQTLDNIEQQGLRSAWTGPVARGDFATVAAQMDALRRLGRDFAAIHAQLYRLGALLLAAEPRATLEALNEALGEN
jgi:predicted short-subunit dehydrogenase-like oxidoreductase (DUF2520 family)